MAKKIKVNYDALNRTAANLESIKTEISGVVTQLNNIASELESSDNNHDNCFSDASQDLKKIAKEYQDYEETIGFLQSQCSAAATAFQSKEGESINASNANAKMRSVINNLNVMINGQPITNFNDYEISVIKGKASTTRSFEEYQGLTNADISRTWSNTFFYDKGHLKTNALISTSATTEIQNEETTPYSNGTGISTITTTTTTTTSPSTTEKSTNDKKEEVKEEKKSETTKKEETTKEDKSDKTTTKKDTEQAPDVIKEPASDNKETTPKATDKPGGNEKFITVTPSTPTNPTIAPQQQAPQTPTQVHTGGGYSGGGYTSSSYTPAATPTPTETPQNPTDQIGTTIKDTSKTSIDDIVKSSKYTKIPTSSTPITQQQTSNKGGASAVIPIAAGLTAAAAAGLGAKAYMDHKKNNEEQDDEEEFNADEWSDDYNTSEVNDSELQTEYLEEDNNYSYEQEPEEKYGARSNEELADLQ